jgi:soluble lytic murein transglycosylase-like protein
MSDTLAQIAQTLGIGPMNFGPASNAATALGANTTPVLHGFGWTQRPDGTWVRTPVQPAPQAEVPVELVAQEQPTPVSPEAAQTVAPPQALPFPTAVPTDTQGAISDLVKAIYGQESGSGSDTRTSSTGARGGMQIEPATFAQYAKPGESIDNPENNLAVGQRIIADLWQKSGGDPARVAVGYFSGPGNIAPVGSPTPWVKNVADPTGKTVSGYVSDILKRTSSTA